jgi:hypothetical protein
MSGINRIGESPSASAQQVLQQRANATPAQKNAAASALQEANETIETTRQEAAKGDQVAIRRLAKQHKTPKSHHTPAPSTAVSTAPTVRTASGGLNTSA